MNTLRVFWEVVVMGPHRDDGGLIWSFYQLKHISLTSYIHISYFGNV